MSASTRAFGNYFQLLVYSGRESHVTSHALFSWRFLPQWMFKYPVKIEYQCPGRHYQADRLEIWWLEHIAFNFSAGWNIRMLKPRWEPEFNRYQFFWNKNLHFRLPFSPTKPLNLYNHKVDRNKPVSSYVAKAFQAFVDCHDCGDYFSSNFFMNFKCL